MKIRNKETGKEVELADSTAELILRKHSNIYELVKEQKSKNGKGKKSPNKTESGEESN